MKILSFFAVFILVSCKSEEKRAVILDDLASKSNNELTISLPVYEVHSQLNKILKEIQKIDQDCNYYDSLRSFYVLFYHKNAVPNLLSIHSEFRDAYDFSNTYGIIEVDKQLFGLEGGDNRNLFIKTNDSIMITYVKDDLDLLLSSDETRSYWYYSIQSDSIFLKSESICK